MIVHVRPILKSVMVMATVSDIWLISFVTDIVTLLSFHQYLYAFSMSLRVKIVEEYHWILCLLFR